MADRSGNPEREQFGSEPDELTEKHLMDLEGAFGDLAQSPEDETTEDAGCFLCRSGLTILTAAAAAGLAIGAFLSSYQ